MSVRPRRSSGPSAPFGLGVHNGEEPEVEIRPLFDPADFDVPGEAEERAKRLGEKLGKA